ncbi:hypothetical protein [Actinomadura latina]|nr:hypothetical protein [Actinomadura latina]
MDKALANPRRTKIDSWPERPVDAESERPVEADATEDLAAR